MRQGLYTSGILHSFAGLLLITNFQLLPDGVRGIVYNFLPRHAAAELIAEGIINKNLKLKYVRNKIWVNTGSLGLPIDWDHRLVPRNTQYQKCPIMELRPTKLLSDTYGNGSIMRTEISIGEKVRLRAIKEGIEKLKT